MKNDSIPKKRDETLKKIVINEWNFFTNVNNIGKRAFCQDNSFTFIYSRLCYWSIYNDIILTSYLSDLISAKKDNRNLLTEKYAYMMQYSEPEYFNKIKKFLPNISKRKNTLVNSIMLIYMYWEEDVRKNEPKLLDNNRDLYDSSQSAANTTIENYFKGELYSYSETTLNLILKYYLSAYQKGINLVEKNLKFLMEK
ncbi:DUF4125 family protein [Peptoniphilus sp. SGI.035]|uniref:DUF4125 family protein n=1 Tax=unclassified Peptoniphilus TaxID=2637196 RepID=UPI0025E2AE94|nr:DUF4125 family protein [Peptoniphilus sp.]MCI5642835.1 DUF4125 family protein [Peptoniphilus sp.]MDD7353233.1 DUF4125 family protein [Peptoniphilaceae bacterium]MDY3903146.1 DUF4125 family protein [Peptoniphilus sp.]